MPATTLTFYSKPDCGPCKPAWAEVASALESRQGRLVLDVHVVPLVTPDEVSAARHRGVRSVPTVIFEGPDGVELRRLTGAEITKAAVLEALAR